MPWFHDDRYDYGRGLPGSPADVHGVVLRKPSQIRKRLGAVGVVHADAPATVFQAMTQDQHREDRRS